MNELELLKDTVEEYRGIILRLAIENEELVMENDKLKDTVEELEYKLNWRQQHNITIDKGWR